MGAPTQNVRETYINELIQKFQKDPASVTKIQGPLLQKFSESQQRAQLVMNRIDQLKKQAEMLANQIRVSEGDMQQEVGKGAGIVDAILTLSDDVPTEGGLPPAPAPNRKTRRAAASKSRKGNGAGKPESSAAAGGKA